MTLAFAGVETMVVVVVSSVSTLEHTVKTPTTDLEVNRIDRIRESEFWRDPDRPSGKFVPVRQRQKPEVRRAKARARTAAWRTRLDRSRTPESREIGMALVAALVTSPNLDHAMTSGELRFVDAALADLQARGFDLEQVKIVLRRIRRRMSDSGDRSVKQSDTPVSKTRPTIF